MLTGVSRTALVTLRARADEQKKKVRRFSDPWAVDWLWRLGWPTELDRAYSSWIQAKTAIRTAQIDEISSTLLAEDPSATVVELACGLSSRRQRLGQRMVGSWIDLDLPEVIALRRDLGISGAGHRHVSGSVLDAGWIDAAEEETSPGRRTIIIAEGLWYYLPLPEVERLFSRLRSRLPGALLVFDVIGKLDYEAALAYTRSIGVPIRWAVQRPFEVAMQRLGLSEIPGLEAEVILEDAIYRVAPWLRPLFRAFVGVKSLRDSRSGLMVGELMPL